MQKTFAAIATALLMAACGADDPEERGPDAETDASSDANVDLGDAFADAGDGASADACGQACVALAAASAAVCVEGAAATFEASCRPLCGTAAEAAVVTAASAGEAAPDAAAVRVVAWLAGVGAACEQSDCSGGADVYSPATGGEPWAGQACVSDGGSYVQVEENVASIGRINAFEQIAELLWRSDDVPSVDDFIAARELYAADEGLDSRVQRREDEHYPPVTDDEGNVLRCRDAGVPDLDPDRCVGPARILPVINQAWQDGIAGVEPRQAAARLEAALLWFIYTSIYKESRTAVATAKDCDSAWAKYTGGQQREGEIGIAREFATVSPAAHAATFDGVLAVRCWRDIDNAATATNLALQDRATEQLDQALNFGFSRMVVARLARLLVSSDVAERAQIAAFVEVAAPILLRETRERDATAGAVLETLLASEALEWDAAAVITRLLASFPCPN